MIQKLKQIIGSQVSYKNRILGSIVIAQLIMISVFTLWPVPDQERTYQDIVFTDNEAIIDEVQITTQKSSPPPPPRPQVPIPVPNDQVVEEEILTLEDIDISEYSDSMSVVGLGRVGESDRIASNPQLPPSIIRIVEPTLPEEAKEAGIKAEILVSFLVDKKGQVEEATISQIRLYGEDDDSFKVVDRVGYGLTEATLEAALQWRFRPAKDQGEVVKSYTKHWFNYGF
ncbi:MAG: energy transducer TonB [Balneolaceae bacterium]|nr:energy transducer TonB [Balneolaceae bacterium]